MSYFQGLFPLQNPHSLTPPRPHPTPRSQTRQKPPKTERSGSKRTRSLRWGAGEARCEGGGGLYMGKMGLICHFSRVLPASTLGDYSQVLVLLALGAHKKGCDNDTFHAVFPSCWIL